MKFSVLLSVYKQENPIFLNQSLKSIYTNQTLRPTEIILVQDGPVTIELDSVIGQWEGYLGSQFKCIRLSKNLGLGDALNVGLKHCSNELVARMDTDDIAHPERFERQLAVLAKYDVDVCSSWITEFDGDETVITGKRVLPEVHADIVRYAKYRCPVNHPAVMYKKSAVEKAGGYKRMMWFEDYYLWVRMLLSGARFYNIQEPLVHMRAGMGQLERRSGLAYGRSELKLLKRFRSLGFISNLEYWKIASLRVPTRLLPSKLVRFIYQILRKNRF